VDGVAFHGYVNSIPAIPEDVNRIVDHVRNVMVARGQSGKPLWDTEGSWGPSEHLTGTMRAWLLSRGITSAVVERRAALLLVCWNDKSYGTLSNPARVRSKKQVWHTHRSKAGYGRQPDCALLGEQSRPDM